MATSYYLSPLEQYRTEKPFHINVPLGGIPGGSHTNEVSEPYAGIAVHDIRGHQDQYSLDREGFEVMAGKNSPDIQCLLATMEPSDYRASDKVVERVGPKFEALLKYHLQAEAVITFAFRFRERHLQFPELPRGTDPRVAQPVQGVHADFTADYARVTAASMAKLRGVPVSDLALTERRWQMVSAWRPLHGPLYDWPLGLLDATTVQYHRDLIASDNVYPHQVSETFNVFHHPSHRWCYLGEHQPHEILLFKSFDSRTRGVARVCAHAAFDLTDPPRRSPARQSIECVSLVLYPRGTAESEPLTNLPGETPCHQDPVGAFNF